MAYPIGKGRADFNLLDQPGDWYPLCDGSLTTLCMEDFVGSQWQGNRAIASPIGSTLWWNQKHSEGTFRFRTTLLTGVIAPTITLFVGDCAGTSGIYAMTPPATLVIAFSGGTWCHWQVVNGGAGANVNMNWNRLPI